jgi:hypothetical protein
MTDLPIIDTSGKRYMRNSQQALVPVEAIRPLDLLIDETVRKIIGYAEPLSAQIARFKRNTFADVGALMSVAEQEYSAAIGGAKGNLTLTSFDGCLRVQVQIADRIDFGPELQIAKSLVDECLTDWSSDSRTEIRAIITRAFAVDQGGRVKTTELLSLLRLDIDDDRWQRAMTAVRDSMRVIGTREYVRFYRRATPSDAWEAVTIDIADAPLREPSK